MQKIINYSLGYLIFGLLSGVYFREITKGIIGIDTTTLGVVHTHAIALGTLFLLIVAIFVKLYSLESDRSWKIFFHSYNTGLIITLITLMVRGTTEVLSISLTKAMNASISGIAGIGHICLTIGMVYFFVILKRAIREEAK